MSGLPSEWAVVVCRETVWGRFFSFGRSAVQCSAGTRMTSARAALAETSREKGVVHWMSVSPASGSQAAGKMHLLLCWADGAQHRPSLGEMTWHARSCEGSCLVM